MMPTFDLLRNCQKARNCLFILSFFILLSAIYAQERSEAEALLIQVDQQLSSRTLQYHLVMEITYSPGDQRTIEADVWAVGRDTAYMEYTAPARERGTRYLKLGKSLWIHQPKLSKSILIQGHMLRQGVLGGDFSYEDMLEKGYLVDDYTAEFLPDQDSLHVLRLTAKHDKVTYAERVLWVDPVLKIPRRSELKAKSGKLLKTVDLNEINIFGGRHYPTKVIMRDILKQKSCTVMRIIDPIFDKKIDQQIFTRRHLERKSL